VELGVFNEGIVEAEREEIAIFFGYNNPRGKISAR
jgi:hypothetical protein